MVARRIWSSGGVQFVRSYISSGGGLCLQPAWSWLQPVAGPLLPMLLRPPSCALLSLYHSLPLLSRVCVPPIGVWPVGVECVPPIGVWPVGVELDQYLNAGVDCIYLYIVLLGQVCVYTNIQPV